ncbi:Sec-independent protein translocase protein TatB [Neptuniibacter sp. QD48_11]|uniref:Sec-independent protein translocase protein TatB n=1 Tax=unclassified Neptuniibacter TaxID=2630693 RepID=UPI0039F4E8A6
MFDIGFTELLIVAVVALVVLGPDKLPTAVRTVGMWMGRIKRTVSSIQTEISEELRVEELKRTTAIQKHELEKELNEMRQPFNDALKEEVPVSSKIVPPEATEEKPQSANEPSKADDNSSTGKA